MDEKKRYYWIKLHKNFFETPDIKILEAQQNGKDYVIFYLKLLLISSSDGGRLRFDNSLPYTPDVLSVLTGTNIDIVEGAIDKLKKLGLISIVDNDTYFLTKINEMIGSESKSAIRKREQRAISNDNKMLLKEQVGHLWDKGGTLVGHCPTEIEIEKEIEIELEKDKKHISSEKEKLFEKFWNMYGIKVGRKQCLAKFIKLKQSDIDKIFETLPAYLDSTPNGKFRKNPLRYINQEAWNDEIRVYEKSNSNYNNNYNNNVHVPKLEELD